MRRREFPLTIAVEWTMTVSVYALALIVLPHLVADAVELPKLSALAISSAILIGIGIGRAVFFRGPVFPATPLTWPLLALLALAVLASLDCPAPPVAREALLYLGAMVLAALFVSSLSNPERLLNAIFVCAAIAAIYGLGQYMDFDPIDWASHFKPRIFSTLGNPVFLGGFLAVIFPLVFARWLTIEKEETKDLLTLLLAILGLAVYLTWTRSSWLALLVSTSVQAGLLARDPAGRSLLRENRVWLLTAAIVGMIAVTLVSSTRIMGSEPVPLIDRLRDALDPQGYSFRFRMVTNESSLRMAFRHPVFGNGPAAFQSIYPHVRLTTRAAKAAKDHYFASQETYAHNDHAQILAETGVIGLGVWCWLLLTAFRLALWRFRSGSWLGLGACGAIAALAVDGALNFPLHIAPTAWVFFVLVGALGTTGSEPEPANHERSWRSWATYGVCLACLFIAFGPISRAMKAQYQRMLGDQQVGWNNFEMASDYYEKALALTPQDKFINFKASASLVKASRFSWSGLALDQAMRESRRAIELGLEDENVYKNLADIYGRKDATPQAIRALDVAQRLNPNREDVANNLAYFLSISGTRLDEALALASTAVSRANGHPAYVDTLGCVQLRMGRLAEAERSFRKALAALPGPPNDVDQQMARREVEDHLAEVARARGGARAR